MKPRAVKGLPDCLAARQRGRGEYTVADEMNTGHVPTGREKRSVPGEPGGRPSFANDPVAREHPRARRARRTVQKRSQLAAQGDRAELIGLLWMRAREGHILAIRTLLDLERGVDDPTEGRIIHRPACAEAEGLLGTPSETGCLGMG